ncbi:MAG TPA: lysophospholipid acyltransferase family protein [Candidatus Cybelea sp.]|nr:lysophospholipid acyltransferase family protein [Candidatus Cybelea sp.]
MRLGKRVIHGNALRGLFCWLTARYIRLVWATGRWRVIGGEHPESFWRADKPFIGAFWHGRILMMPCAWSTNRRMNMLISQHRDGELIARTIGHFGLCALRGSSRKGGTQALRAMLRALRAGECVGVTPDGPRGPRMRAADGIVSLARLAGIPILPATFGVSRRRLLSSWDRFVIALPFSRGVIVWGAPIKVAEDADAAAIEAARAAVEAALNRITDEADRQCGQTPVPPDDARA